MPKKRNNKKQVSVRAGKISDINERLPGDNTTDAPPPELINIGSVNVAGRNITTNQTVTGMSPAEINQLFDGLYNAIETRANTTREDKEDLQANVKEIQYMITEAVQKNVKVDEGFLSRRFRNITRMAPDVLDIVVATLGNPLAGLGVAVKMVAERVKIEARMPGDSTTAAPPPDVKKKSKGKGK